MEELRRPTMIMPHLIGRASQFATLQLLTEHAKQGEGRIVLIGGEAGIGKTRLVGEIKNSVVTQGFQLLQGNCFPIDRTYPYAPLLDLLRTLFASRPPTPLAAELEQLARDLFPLLPELVLSPMTASVILEPEQEKRRLFAVLANFFLQLSISSPLLLVVEDVHWSDSTSLDFLHLLARRAVSQALLLVVTYRSDEMQMRAEARDWLAQLTRERLAEVLQLTHLARHDVDEMLLTLFDPHHTAFDMRRFLHGELLETLYTLTEGNPFFVEETLSAMIAAGDIFYTQGYWNRRPQPAERVPQSVQDAVQQRTRHLGEAARQVLTLAAVAGRQFDFVLLQQLTGYNEEQLILAMKELVSAQLVVEEATDQFAFRHALTRRAIYTQLLARERASVHRRIAEVMEQESSLGLDAHLEALATHFYQAGAWQKASDYAQRAGEKALRLYTHRAAIEYFTWTLSAAQHLSLALPCATLRARGQAYEMLGEFEQAQQDYNQALETARALHDRAAEWQSAIDLGSLWVGRDYTQAEVWFRQALALAQTLDDPVLHARSLNRIGNWYINAEQSQEALYSHQEALNIFQRLHDERGIAETLDLLGMASYLGGDLVGGTTYYQQASASFRALGDKSGLVSVLATLALRGPTYQTDGLISAASLPEACQDAELALNLAREIGQRSAEAYALFQLGLGLGSRGEYGRALAAARQSLEIAEEIEHRQWQTAAHAAPGGIYIGLLAYTQAREQVEQAFALAKEVGSLVWMRITTGYLASIFILLQDLTQAETLLRAALAADASARSMAQRMIWCASIELELARGEPLRALEKIEQVSAEAGSGSKEQKSLRLLKLRGEALTLLPQPEEAISVFEEARELASLQGARPMQWRLCVALGKLFQAQGQTTEAEQAFASARALIEELAATLTDEALRDHFLQQALAMLPHARPSSSKQAAKQAYGGLTAREREIATLIAQGKYNREIADLLVLSERTIETHVSNILLKLNFTSRRQIANWARERGLTAHS